MEIGDIVQPVAIIVAGVSILFGLRGVKKQIWVTVFSEYTNRYANIMDQLPYESRSPDSDKGLSEYDDDQRQLIINAARKYANLCSEEMYLHSQGHLDRSTWDIWKVGIRETMKLKILDESWNIINHEYASYPEFQSLMNEVSKPNGA